MSRSRNNGGDSQQTVAHRDKGGSTPQSVDVLRTGLPANAEAERLVLAAVMTGHASFQEIAVLRPGDFSVEKNSILFQVMQSMSLRNEPIDRVTVANELCRHDELHIISLGELASLEDGMPTLPHIERWVRVIQEKSALKQMILAAQALLNESLLETASPVEIFDSFSARMEVLRVACSGGNRAIRRIEDLESIFTKRAPVQYLVKPELPVKTIVCLTGDSESGKTTLASAWGRQALAEGHAVLILDRDRNPRERICDRLERLGIRPDTPRLWVWDCEQADEPPQPNAPILVDWVKRMVAETGKSPLIIVDSLVSFFMEDEGENSATDMRALFDRCRVLNTHGGTVLCIHHTNRMGKARGSSDFRPASDQASLVTNSDGDGGRKLDRITLSVEKSRYGLSDTIRYDYAGGKMLRLDGQPTFETVTQQLEKLLRDTPGVLSERFGELAAAIGVGRNRAREYLTAGLLAGTIRIEKAGRKKRHFWVGRSQKTDGASDQSRLHLV